jgi:hypothetical protein
MKITVSKARAWLIEIADRDEKVSRNTSRSAVFDAEGMLGTHGLFLN